MTRKARKAQTVEEYAAQRQQFYAEGPRVNTEDWLYDAAQPHRLSDADKADRVVVLHACERAYYRRDYQRCMALIEGAQRLFGLDADASRAAQEAEYAARGVKVKKTAKVERHIVELLYIKERCQQALALAGLPPPDEQR